MDTDGHRLRTEDQLGAGAHAALTHAIIGAAFDVLNELGHGLREKTYENALVVEFRLRGVGYSQQTSFPVFYKEVQVDEYIPDLLVGDEVVVDAKTIERITDVERGQMLNYLRITNRSVGLILNFKRPKLEWERIAL